MKNFVFHNPVKVIFGKGSISQIGAETKLLGTNALLVCGKISAVQSGVYRQVCKSLQEAGICVETLSGIQPNPLLSKVHTGIEIARRKKSHVIIALGGGSVMDTAKAIASGVSVKHDVWKFFTGKKSVTDPLPVICIPTIAGSGSEMNSGMVLTHDEKQLKLGFAHRKLFPRVCLADPLTTFSVSPELTAYGAIDSITHCLEAYFTTELFEQSVFQITLMENICSTIMNSCRGALKKPHSYEDRASLLWTGSIALSGLTTAGIGRISFPMHLISHGLSIILGVPHGAGLSAVLPGWMRYQEMSIQNRLTRLGASVFNVLPKSDHNNSSEIIHCLESFLTSLNCPVSLTEIGLASDQFEPLKEHCLQQARIWRMTDYNSDTIVSILNACR